MYSSVKYAAETEQKAPNLLKFEKSGIDLTNFQKEFCPRQLKVYAMPFMCQTNVQMDTGVNKMTKTGTIINVAAQL